MLKLLTDLINEHGSAVIMKERLQLVADKYELLEEKNRTLEDRNKDLAELLEGANEKITRLEALLNQASSKNEIVSLKKEAERVLNLLFNNDELIPAAIANKLSITEGIVQYYLDQLEEKDLACVSSAGMNGVNWCITSNGRKHIVEIVGV